MGKATRRRYSPKLKFQVVLEVLSGQKSPAQVGKAYGYRRTKTELEGLGISAMPSMHVSIAVLMALLGNLHPALARLGLCDLCAGNRRRVGTPGWHYAIDAYVAAVATVGIWWLVGRWYAGGGTRGRCPIRKIH